MQLQNEGFQVTQATLSRDLKHLQIRKAAESGDAYVYSLPEADFLRENHQNHVHDLIRGYLSIHFSHPMAVVRTLTGHAASVALALDNLRIPGLLGTVAGDDTVLLVLEAGTDNSTFLANLRSRAPEFEE